MNIPTVPRGCSRTYTMTELLGIYEKALKVLVIVKIEDEGIRSKQTSRHVEFLKYMYPNSEIEIKEEDTILSGKSYDVVWIDEDDKLCLE